MKPADKLLKVVLVHIDRYEDSDIDCNCGAMDIIEAIRDAVNEFRTTEDEGKFENQMAWGVFALGEISAALYRDYPEIYDELEMTCSGFRCFLGKE